MDGVGALGNVLVVGLTNRRELIEPALLRPGRCEAQRGALDACGVRANGYAASSRLERPGP